MAKLLLDLRHVPGDEADDVRVFLDAAGIGYYETRPNRWGITAGGIWIADDGEHPRARELMDAYQATRRERARAEYAAARSEGRLPGLGAQFRDDPLRVVGILAAIAFVAGLAALPYFLLR
ncbi:DUF6164 family protein [Coralloluteibacterium stylophorae]|uniref:DUF2007 domain-containing protein n=1 Tax=Coralloluteibacterium stylophorae TaxID=1776034 RepID=A0A8J7VSI5_9GAMM|nr:DUF6164 family protein [Coralloluteibacterium stylophorae]MBS7455535.1 hypothetical protein [Coralloluteibacterium stylophorae]